MLPYEEALVGPCFPDEKTEPQKGQAQQAEVQWEEEGGLSLPGAPGWETRCQRSKPGSATRGLGDTGKRHFTSLGLTILTWKMGIIKDPPPRANVK